MIRRRFLATLAPLALMLRSQSFAGPVPPASPVPAGPPEVRSRIRGSHHVGQRFVGITQTFDGPMTFDRCIFEDCRLAFPGGQLTLTNSMSDRSSFHVEGWDSLIVGNVFRQTKFKAGQPERSWPGTIHGNYTIGIYSFGPGGRGFAVIEPPTEGDHE